MNGFEVTHPWNRTAVTVLWCITWLWTWKFLLLGFLDSVISRAHSIHRDYRRLQWLQSVFKLRPELGKKWPVFRYWRQPGHWPSSPSSDHRPETRPGPSDTAWHQTLEAGSYLPLSCRAAVCSAHSPVLQTIMQRPETSTTTKWRGCELWCVKRNCLEEKQG